jgi:hypothetical protein
VEKSLAARLLDKAAMERAMKVQEVILPALAKRIKCGKRPRL